MACEQVLQSAPGRIRTSDPRIRSPLLCPLSYGRVRQAYRRIRTAPVALPWLVPYAEVGRHDGDVLTVEHSRGGGDVHG